LLVSWCSDGRCGMAGSDEDRGRSRRPGAEDRGWLSTCRVISNRAIGRSGDAMCDLYHPHGDEEGSFLGLASKLMGAICQWFSLKNTMTVCQWFDLKITRTVFFDLDLKPMATVSLGLVSKPVA
jgi:hypothetical protein